MCIYVLAKSTTAEGIELRRLSGRDRNLIHEISVSALTYGVLFTPFFIKKFAPTSGGIRKLELEGCVKCGWFCVGQMLDGF